MEHVAEQRRSRLRSGWSFDEARLSRPLAAERSAAHTKNAAISPRATLSPGQYALFSGGLLVLWCAAGHRFVPLDERSYSSTKMFLCAHKSLSTLGQTVTETSPRCAFLSSIM